MADDTNHIFISYKTQELEYAEQLRQVLEKLGFCVWLDREIQTGGAWHAEIDQKLRSASCVLVLWSKRAVESKWVGHEAAHAMTRHVYAPCIIERVDVPLPFNSAQAASLVGWDGRVGSADFKSLLNRIAQLTSTSPNLSEIKTPFAPWPMAVPNAALWRLVAWIRTNIVGLFAVFLAVTTLGSVLFSRNQQLAALEQQNNLSSALNRDLEQLLQDVKNQSLKSLYPLHPIGVSFTWEVDLDDGRIASYANRIRKLRSHEVERGSGNILAWGQDDQISRFQLYESSPLWPTAGEQPAGWLLATLDGTVTISRPGIGGEFLTFRAHAWNESSSPYIENHVLEYKKDPTIHLSLDADFHSSQRFRVYVRTDVVKRSKDSGSFLGLPDLEGCQITIRAGRARRITGFELHLGPGLKSIYSFSDEKLEVLGTEDGVPSSYVINVSKSDLRLDSK